MVEEIESKVIGLIADALRMRGLDVHPTLEMSLIDSGILDSLSIVNFVGCLEKSFGIEIGMSDVTLDNFDNAKLISDLVRAKLSGA